MFIYIIMYKCEKCGKEFEFNSLLIRHTSKKISCDTLINIIKTHDDKIIDIDKKIEDIDNEIEQKAEQSIEEKTKCLFCDKLFLNKANTLRHINSYCIAKKELYNTKNKLIDEKNILINEKEKNIENKKNRDRDEEIKILRDQVSKLIKKQTMQNINITKNITNNITNNNLMINLNSFGKEDLSHISLNDYKKYLGGFFPGFIKFIEKVHFDDNAPENHNINITNLKSKYLHIYENNQWTTKEKVDVLDKFINKKYNMLVDKCEELEEKNEIDEKIIDDFMQFTQNYKNEEAQKNTQKKILLMMYNNKDKIDMKQTEIVS